MDIARELEIPAHVISPRDYESATEWEDAILGALRAYEIDFVALAGYLRIVGKPLLEAFPDRIVNLHPALLPAYPGLHIIEQIWRDAASSNLEVAAAAKAAAGVTVHLIDAGMDTGPVIAQQAIDVTEYSTEAEFEAAVHTVEHELFPQVIADLSHKIQRVQKEGTPYWLKRAQSKEK